VWLRVFDSRDGVSPADAYPPRRYVGQAPADWPAHSSVALSTWWGLVALGHGPDRVGDLFMCPAIGTIPASSLRASRAPSPAGREVRCHQVRDLARPSPVSDGEQASSSKPRSRAHPRNAAAICAVESTRTPSISNSSARHSKPTSPTPPPGDDSQLDARIVDEQSDIGCGVRRGLRSAEEARRYRGLVCNGLLKRHAESGEGSQAACSVNNLRYPNHS
jgi:hypothetical protein